MQNRLELDRNGRRLLLVFACAALILPACLNDAAEPTIDLDATNPPGTAITLPTAIPSPTTAPTPSVAPWLLSLLESGPAAAVSPVSFFRNGPDLWIIEGDLSVRPVTEGRRIRTVATVPGTSSAAAVVIDSSGGRETEEVRIIEENGDESEPIYGPEIVGDPAGNPGIVALHWSPNGEVLAIVREDASIWLASPDQTAEPFPDANLPDEITGLGWSPAGDALIISMPNTTGGGSLRILPLDGEGFFDILPLASFGAATWLPGASRIIAAEDRRAGFNSNAGTLFSLQPDGSNRELLISAGEFGPAVEIGIVHPSPDGSLLAFTVETPGPDGAMRFQSLRIYEFGTGILRTIEIATGQNVTDLWWLGGRLAWRSVESADGGQYSGVEPFSIKVFDGEVGETSLIFTSTGS